jgi:ariadne-1
MWKANRRTTASSKDLEIATEQLSEYLERDITSDMLQDIKQKVQDKYR